jgi:hypothetical protein
MAPALGVAMLWASQPAAAQVAPGDVLVTSLTTDAVYRLDPSAPAPMAPVLVPTAGPFVSPTGLAVDRNGLLLVNDNGPKTMLRVDPSQGLRALAAQFSTVVANLRGVVEASDGRVFIADPGQVLPQQPPVRGLSYFPVISVVDVVGGVSFGAPVAGCPIITNCGNLYFPSGVAVESEAPELTLLVADAGELDGTGPGRIHQGVIRIFADRPLGIPTNPAEYPVVGTNDELFCAPGPFATPRSLSIDRSPGREGSVLVTDSGNAALGIPARVFRIAPGGCDPLEDPPVEIVAEGNGLLRPIGIAVAVGIDMVEDGTIFVADATADTVFRIDPGTGSVSPLSNVGSIDQAWDLQLQRARPGPYFVADASVPALLDVDPAAPARTTLSSGGSFVSPAALEVLPAAAGVVVADPTARAVIEVALSGAQTVASQAGRLSAPTSASLEVAGTYLVTDLGDAGAVPPVLPSVIRVDKNQVPPDDQTVVSEGGKLVQPVAGAIDARGYLIVADAGDGSEANPPRILRISPEAGQGAAGQVVLSPEPTQPPDPPATLLPLYSPAALALEEGGDVILVADRGDATHPPGVLRLTRSLAPPGVISLDLSVALASAGLLETPAGLAIDSDGSLLVSDEGDPATADDGTVIRIDALSGLQSPVATAGTLELPTGIGVQAPAPGTFLDQDGDHVVDSDDNCISVANTDQRDTDSPPDGIGNACDPDYNDDGIVGSLDFSALREALGSDVNDPEPNRYDPDIDADGDGTIGTFEFDLLLGCYGGRPGMSGLHFFDPAADYCRPSLVAP